MGRYAPGDLLEQVSGLPGHLQWWLLWLVVITLLMPLVMSRNSLPRMVLLFQAANLVFGSLLASNYGLVRLLGLSHLLFWTPPLVLALREFGSAKIGGVYALWLKCFIATVSVSLVVDFVDVVRYLAGERDLLAAIVVLADNAQIP